jgi:uncharacterized protein (TIGR03437 family)
MPRLLAVFAAIAALLRAANSTPPLYRIETVAGSSNNGDGGPAIAAQIGAIQGIAVDRLGNIYLSDTDHHRIRRVSVTGIITTVAGTGASGWSGDGGPATAAQLNLPYGIAADLNGNVYIADLGNNRVRLLAPDGTISTLAGTGTAGSAGDGAAATAAQVSSPRNLAIDAAHNLYVSEFAGHRIRKISPDGKISTFAGTGSPGYSGDGGLAPAAQLNWPAGLAFDRQGNLYVADSLNNRIRKIAPGGTITTALGASGGMATPFALTVNGLGSVYVGDAAMTVVYGYTAAGKRVLFAGGATQDFQGDGGPAAKACLSNVLDLAVDLSGNIYLADGPRVRRVDLQGVINTVAGDGFLHAVGDLTNATDAILHRPSAVALDAAGNLFVADTGTQRVRQVLHSGTIVTMADGLVSPSGVALDAQGHPYVSDAGANRILEITGVGLASAVVGTGQAGVGPESQLPNVTPLHSPEGICFDRNGTLFVADSANHRVLRIASVIQILAGTGAPGSAGDGSSAHSAQLNQPSACAADSSGNLFVADTLNHRIRRVTSAGIISTVAGTGDSGASGDEGPATSARLNSPRGVAIGADGSVFIADTGNHLIRQITPDGVIHTVAGGVGAGFAGDGGPATSALLSAPAGIAIDASGAIYFADTGNDRVRRLVPLQSLAPPVVAATDTAPVNAASLAGGPVAPGEVIIIYGKGIGPDTGAPAAYDSQGMLPLTLGGTQVLFDSAPAPLFYAQAGEVHAQVPYAVAGNKSTHVDVMYSGQKVLSIDLIVAASAPGLYPVAVNADGSPNSSANPAAVGTVITLYATGEGLLDSAVATGQAAQAPYPHPKLPVKLTIGGLAADIAGAFSTPGIAGMLQVNAALPALKPGAAAVTLTIGAATSQQFAVFVK